MKSKEAYDKILCKVNTKYGAPMGRQNQATEWGYCSRFPGYGPMPPHDKRIFDRIVYLDSGGYDKGGAYWGIGGTLRVAYTSDLSFVRFYRT